MNQHEAAQLQRLQDRVRDAELETERLKTENARLREEIILLQRSKVRAYTSLQAANDTIAALCEVE